MSKSVKKIVAVVAAIAIPFAAPAIASAIGLSSAVAGAVGSAAAGSAIGSALTGAALGAATGAVTGQDIGRSALMGAISGGVGGYVQAPTAAASAAPSGGGFFSPTGGGAGLTTAASAAPTAAVTAPSAVGGFFSPTGGAAAFNTAANAATAAPSIGARLGEALRGTGRAIADKFLDPKNLADLTLRAAGQLAGSALAGSGLSAEEQALLNAQAADLESLKNTNQELYRLRLDQAKALLGEAARDYGAEEEARAQVRGVGLTRQALRGLTGERRRAEEAEQLRARAEERATGRARGELMSAQNRVATRQAGLALLPSAPEIATMNARTSLMNMYGEREASRAEKAGQIGDWFGALTGQRGSQSAGNETPEERQRRLEEERRGR